MELAWFVAIAGLLLMAAQTVSFVQQRKLSRFKAISDIAKTIQDLDLNDLSPITKDYIYTISRAIAKKYLKYKDPESRESGRKLLAVAKELKKGNHLNEIQQNYLKDQLDSPYVRIQLL